MSALRPNSSSQVSALVVRPLILTAFKRRHLFLQPMRGHRLIKWGHVSTASALRKKSRLIVTGNAEGFPNVLFDDSEGSEGSRPVIEHKSSNMNVIAKENERVVLPCIAFGHPRPTHK